LNIMRLRGKD
jgi:hypothetical protein